MIHQRLPKDLLRRFDHMAIDQNFASRQEALEWVLTHFLDEYEATHPTWPNYGKAL